MRDNFKRAFKNYSKFIVYVALSIVCVVFIPMFINWLISKSSPFSGFQHIGKTEEWLAFFGNYAGAGMGVLFAVLVSRYQISENRKDLQNQLNEEKKQRVSADEQAELLRGLDRRMYIDFSWITAG